MACCTKNCTKRCLWHKYSFWDRSRWGFLLEEQNTADLGQYSIDVGSISLLIRDDVQSDNVDVSKLNLNMSKDNDDNFINDGEEDYTLMDYDDENVDNPPDEDTDIE